MLNRYRRLREIARKIREQQVVIDEMREALDNRPTLINIERIGRKNRFTFVRNGQFTYIETLGRWEDDVSSWRKQLLNE